MSASRRALLTATVAARALGGPRIQAESNIPRTRAARAPGRLPFAPATGGTNDHRRQLVDERLEMRRGSGWTVLLQTRVALVPASPMPTSAVVMSSLPSGGSNPARPICLVPTLGITIART